MPEGIPGLQPPIRSGNTILINRRKSLGRKTFGLAYELPHVPTLGAISSEWVDHRNSSNHKGKKLEQLADNFAATLLMPARDFLRRWETGFQPSSGRADHYQLSRRAAVWRFVVLGEIKTARPNH